MNHYGLVSLFLPSHNFFYDLVMSLDHCFHYNMQSALTKDGFEATGWLLIHEVALGQYFIVLSKAI